MVSTFTYLKYIIPKSLIILILGITPVDPQMALKIHVTLKIGNFLKNGERATYFAS